MYINFYGLKEKPFNLTPDSHFLFLGTHHKEALGHIRYGLSYKKGFLLISGEVGAGKTTLCRAILREMDKNHKIAFVLNTMLSPTGLLKAIMKDLGIKTKVRSRHDMMAALNEYILTERNVVIVIDEAQNLGISTLEQVRLLGNIETEKEKLLQIVLVGQPELKKRLSDPRLRQLNQRISIRYHLEPLNREEVTQYIYYRLKIAGSEDRIRFHEDALSKIYNYSGGIPRLINIICDYCLMCGYINESYLINEDMVEESIINFQGASTKDAVLV